MDATPIRDITINGDAIIIKDPQIRKVLTEIQKKLQAYANLLAVRYLNLCVKADAVALLSTTVLYNGESLDLEECCKLTIPNEFRFEIYPNSTELLEPIRQGIFEAHPEFKPSLRQPTELNIGDEDYRSLILDMPEVDDDRYDFLTKGIGGLLKEFKAKVDFFYNKGKVDLAPVCVGKSKEVIDDTDKKLDEIKDHFVDNGEKIYQMKLDEIEDAHKHWQEKQQAAKPKPKEYDAAHTHKLGEYEE